MTTNISLLPNGLSGTFVVATNADWRDVIQFQYSAPDPRAGQPIDITGISFEAQVRPSIDDTGVVLDMSTANGLLVTDGPLGQLSFAVPRDQAAGASTGCTTDLENIQSGGVLDIVASDPVAGIIINLCQVSGSLTLKVNTGVTRE